MGRRTKWSEPGLERTIVEAIKAARRLIALQKWNPLLARAHKVAGRHLVHLEKELQRTRRKPLSQPRLHEIGREVAKLIGDLVMSLIRYLFPRLPKSRLMPHLGASWS